LFEIAIGDGVTLNCRRHGGFAAAEKVPTNEREGKSQQEEDEEGGRGISWVPFKCHPGC